MLMALVLAVSLHDIAWLAGDWEMTRGGECIEEHWTLPSQTSAMGMSRTIRNGSTTAFEFLRIEARSDGVFYVAQPGGRPPVDFALSSAEGRELVFVNPGHADHLKRIVYRRDADDRLTARVEGEDGGRSFVVEYAYRRAPSDVGSRCGAR